MKGFQESGKKVNKFYGDKAYYGDEVYDLAVDVISPSRNASVECGSGAKRKVVEEFKGLGNEH